ncbi:MAG: nuclear transport factor 2 family protein, partial [Microcoleus sp. SIO2G3]|nr:nuclear transport factor 2 family protein [Microcoleus sp. SIO2G3]
QDQSHFKAVQHTTTNHFVSIENNGAYCTANVRAQHLLLDDQHDRFWTLVGRYVYQLLRTQTGWRICGCTISVYWTEPNT